MAGEWQVSGLTTDMLEGRNEGGKLPHGPTHRQPRIGSTSRSNACLYSCEANKSGIDISSLDNLALVEHDDAPADVGHDGEVVGDQQASASGRLSIRTQLNSCGCGFELVR